MRTFKQMSLMAVASLAWLGLAAEKAEAKTLVYCLEASPKYLSAPFTSSTGESDIMNQVFDGLVEFESGTTKVQPGLAESWEVSPDGLTYTFKLRKGVKFHANKDFKPTRDFNADDVIFTFERQLKADHPYHKVSGGTYVFFDSIGLGNIIESVKKLDDHTVQFKLKQPESPLLLDLAIAGFGSVMSAEFADQMMKAGTPEKFDLTPIGTGPFTFVDYQKDSKVRFKANADYWGGKPKIDDLIFSIVTDAGTRLAKLEKGECHVLPFPNLADVEKMRKNPDLVLLEQEGLNMGYLALNTQKKPFDDPKVRKALAMAINKQAIIDSVFQKHGTPATNPIPPILWGYNKEIKDYPYDPEQAKKLLAEAGFPNGFDVDLWYMPVPRPYNPNGKRVAELIQADWAAIGVKAKPVTYEWGEYIKRGQEGEHQAYMLGWQGDNGDPDNFLHTLFSCDAIKGKNNHAFWCNKEFDAAVLEAKKTADLNERTKLYEKAQTIFHEDLPAIPLAHSRAIRPVRKEVKGYKQSPIGDSDFKDVDIEEKK